MIKRVLPALVCLVLFAQTAGAHLITKPARCPKPPAAPSLQQILDGLVVSGPAIDAGAPANIDLWDNASGPMSANVVVDYTGRSDALWFGMYPADDSGNHAFLLSDSMSPDDVASVSFSDDGSITIRGGLTPKAKASGFDGPFGFFAKVASAHSDSPVYLFTEADLNGGEVRVKVFAGNGTTTLKFPGQSPGLFLTNQYLLAFETGNDGGFNDFIVSVSNIVAVPEPAIAWLLGFSALAVLSGRRVRNT
jgi:hypothetical protein